MTTRILRTWRIRWASTQAALLVWPQQSLSQRGCSFFHSLLVTIDRGHGLGHGLAMALVMGWPWPCWSWAGHGLGHELAMALVMGWPWPWSWAGHDLVGHGWPWPWSTLSWACMTGTEESMQVHAPRQANVGSVPQVGRGRGLCRPYTHGHARPQR